MPAPEITLQSLAAPLRALSGVSRVREKILNDQPHLVCTLAQSTFGRNLRVLVTVPEAGVLFIVVPNLMTLPLDESFERVRELADTIDDMLCGTTRVSSKGKLHYSMALPAGNSADSLESLIRVVGRELHAVLGSVLAITLDTLLHIGSETAVSMARELDAGQGDADEDTEERIAI